MANQVHIGRLSFTSPSQLSISAAPDGRGLSVTGQFGGVENTLEHL